MTAISGLITSIFQVERNIQYKTIDHIINKVPTKKARRELNTYDVSELTLSLLFVDQVR